MPEPTPCCLCCSAKPNPACQVCAAFTKLSVQIESAAATTDDFNVLFEAMAKSAEERIARRTRMPKSEPREFSPMGRVVPKKPGDNDPNQHRGRRNFRGQAKASQDRHQRLAHRLSEEELLKERLWVYQCPHCGGDAYNGQPGQGTKFRGSGMCSECNQGFSIVGLKLKPIRKDGPLLYTPEALQRDLAHAAEFDARMAKLSQESRDFLTNYGGKPLAECTAALEQLSDRNSLRTFLAQALIDDDSRILCEQRLPDNWSYRVVRVIDLLARKGRAGPTSRSA